MLIKKITIEDYKPSRPEKNDDDEENNNLISTPFGIYKINDSMNPAKQFNLKMVNTNFPVTVGTKAILDNLEGIEIFFPITKYKFIIGIGKIFNEKDVEENIRKTLIGEKEVNIYKSSVTNKKLNDLISKLKDTSKLWVIYALPNGNLDYTCENVLEKLLFYKEAQTYSKGQIVISEKLEEKLKNEKSK
jgi:hypothetical protein